MGLLIEDMATPDQAAAFLARSERNIRKKYNYPDEINGQLRRLTRRMDATKPSWNRTLGRPIPPPPRALILNPNAPPFEMSPLDSLLVERASQIKPSGKRGGRGKAARNEDEADSIIPFTAATAAFIPSGPPQLNSALIFPTDSQGAADPELSDSEQPISHKQPLSLLSGGGAADTYIQTAQTAGMAGYEMGGGYGRYRRGYNPRDYEDCDDDSDYECVGMAQGL
jgi:hypothetical protein